MAVVYAGAGLANTLMTAGWPAKRKQRAGPLWPKTLRPLRV